MPSDRLDDGVHPYQEQQIALREALAAIKPPNLVTGDGEILSIEEVAEMLDKVVGEGAHLAAQARTAANEIGADMERALALHIRAGTLVADVARIRAIIQSAETQAKAMAEAAEQALAVAVNTTGTPRVEIDSHTAGPKRATKRVVITDADALPLEVMVQPPRPKAKPSLELIRAMLLTGQPCPGAELVDAEPGINIKARTVNR